MAASKPICWLYSKRTPLISLNNNFGTLHFCSGLFPFRHTTLAYYVWEFKIDLLPFRKQILTDKISTIPQCMEENFPEITIVYLQRSNLNHLRK